MNEASTPLCALLMRRYVLILALVGLSSAIRCHLYHDIWEAGKRMTILPDKCTSDTYCVYASYKDKNWKKKNGFSQGCDRVDCIEASNAMNTAWKKTSDNKICRKHKDYGDEGEICCCTTELCNTSSAALYTIIVSIAFVVLIHLT